MSGESPDAEDPLFLAHRQIVTGTGEDLTRPQGSARKLAEKLAGMPNQFAGRRPHGEWTLEEIRREGDFSQRAVEDSGGGASAKREQDARKLEELLRPLTPPSLDTEKVKRLEGESDIERVKRLEREGILPRDPLLPPFDPFEADDSPDRGFEETEGDLPDDLPRRGSPFSATEDSLAGPRPPSMEVKAYHERVGARNFAKKVQETLQLTGETPDQLLARVAALVHSALQE